jgi:hypothetical protein
LKALFLFPLILISGAAVAGTSCSNATGTLTYSDFQYEGGPAPVEGMLIGGETWSYRGQVIAQAEQHQGAPFQTLAIAMTEGQRVTLENNSGGTGNDQTYATKITLTRRDGTAVLPDNGAKTVTEFFLCHEVHHFYP